MIRYAAVVLFAAACGFILGCSQSERGPNAVSSDVSAGSTSDSADSLVGEASNESLQVDKKSDARFDDGLAEEAVANELPLASEPMRRERLAKPASALVTAPQQAHFAEQPASTKMQRGGQSLTLAADFDETRQLSANRDRNASGELYESVQENDFLAAAENPLSTFSIDVDTASYSNTRRFLRQGSLPPADAVRIEELINYFSYDYPQPAGDEPFSVNVELADCPWQPQHRLAKIGLQGRKMEMQERPASNLVFLLDVSGSMRNQNKLPLVKKAMGMLIDQLDEQDRIAIAVYASASGLVLPSTRADEKEVILSAMDSLQAGGSTNGGQGIQLAYNVAQENFIEGGVNRVILCTDGDFNVGITDRNDLTNLIAERAKQGTFLSVLGFGMGNLKDSTMEQLADKGNGNYAYIDSRQEARKVLVEEAAATLVTIAKDVKIQVDFNPALVQSYRLIGYENRMLAAEDFKDDTKDAGEIGAGHSVTALYQIVPVGVVDKSAAEPSKYTATEADGTANLELTEAAHSGELLTVRLRYKQPDADKSTEFRVAVEDERRDFADASGDMQFAAAVAEFGMILKNSKHRGSATLEEVVEIASSHAVDEHGYRAEFLKLAIDARNLRVPDGSRGDRIGFYRR